jgi:hypothetical protein
MTMTTKLGLVIGSVMALCYLFLVLRVGHAKPSLSSFITVILSGVAAASGILLIRLSVAAADSDMGIFAPHRISIFLGGVAVCWTAIESVIGPFRRDCARPARAPDGSMGEAAVLGPEAPSR